MKRLTTCWMIAGLAVTGDVALAQARPTADSASAPGPQSHQELPKVLYIVPWKKAAQGDAAGRPQLSVVNEELAPLDPDVFRRQMQYQTQQQAKQQASSAGAAAKTATP